MTRAFSVARGAWKRFARDRGTLAVAILVPVLGFLVLGGAHAGDDPHKVYVILLDDGTASGPTGVRQYDLGRAMLDAVDPTVLDIEIVSDSGAAREGVARGEAVAMLVLPPAFTEDASKGRSAGFVVVNAVDAAVAEETLRELDRAARAAVQSTVPGASADVLSIDTVAGAIDEGRSWLVGAAALVVTASILSLVLHVVVRQRTDGTLERTLASTGHAPDLIVGHGIAFGAVAIAQTSLVLVAARVLGLTVAGSYGVFLLIFVSYAAFVLAAALAAGAFVRTDTQGFVVLASALGATGFLAGVFWPVEGMWAPFALVGNVVPLAWGLPAARAVAAGMDATSAALPIAGYIALSGIGFGLATWRLRRGP